MMENKDFISIPKDVIKLLADYLKEESVEDKIADSIRCEYDGEYYIVRMAAYYEYAIDIDISFKFAADGPIFFKDSLLDQEIYYLEGDDKISLKRLARSRYLIQLYHFEKYLSFCLDIRELELRELFYSAFLERQQKYPAIGQIIETKGAILFCEIIKNDAEVVREKVEFFNDGLSIELSNEHIAINFYISIITRGDENTNSRIVYFENGGEIYYIKSGGMIGIADDNMKLLLYLDHKDFLLLKYK